MNNENGSQSKLRQIAYRPKTNSLLINIHISFLTTVHFFASNETYFNHKKEDVFDFSRCIPSIN